MGLIMLILPRKYAIIPLLISSCYVTLGQRVVIEGLDFTMMRIMVLFGWARLVLRKETWAIELNSIDKVIILWTLSSIISYTLLWQTSAAFINRLGHAFNTIGMYFLFRFIIKDMDDILRIIKALSIITIPLAVAMLLEKATGRNVFAVLGGVPKTTAVRAGRLRCQGSFGHPILAGTFGATLLPLFFILWVRGGRDRLISVVGGISSTIITVASASSGPVLTYIFGLVGLFGWVFRHHMRVIRWSLIFGLVALHLIMKAPVWFVIARVNVFSGSTGFHRAYLIDRAIEFIDEWWLIGTKSTGHWGYNLWDITNAYLVEGIRGGLPTMILFILVIVLCFGNIGRVLQVIEDDPFAVRICYWSMGAALFAHTITFLSVSYFDQMVVFWYLLLALISTATENPIAPEYQEKRSAQL
jgi:hypothetical protein